MNKAKLFIDNFLVYGMGGIIQKIIPLIMVPIVTRLMPNSSYYGISDLSGTILSFASAIAIMGMYDAMYRMFFEKEDDENYKKGICSTALVFTIITSVIIFILMICFHNVLAEYVLKSKKYGYIIYITAVAALVGSTNSIVSAPTRMQNKRKIFLIMNFVSPILSYSISIPLLLAGYYVIALPLSGLITAISSEVIFWSLNRKWFDVKRFDPECLKPMLKIAIPLLPNFLIYWVFNSSDKIMIANLIGVHAAGLYSVGSKLGHASQLIYTAFASGWQYFAFSTMKEKNQVKTNSLIFEYLGIISFGCSAFVFAFSHTIYDILFTGEYVEGYIVSPYLFLAPLMQMLFQIAANQFIVVKKTWPNMFILSSGAVVNVLLNIIIIPKIGIEGAAIATLIGYVISDIICVIVLIRMKLMIINLKFVISALIMLTYTILWRLIFKDNFFISIFMAVILCSFYFWIYREEMKKFWFAVKRKKKV